MSRRQLLWTPSRRTLQATQTYIKCQVVELFFQCFGLMFRKRFSCLRGSGSLILILDRTLDLLRSTTGTLPLPFDAVSKGDEEGRVSHGGLLDVFVSFCLLLLFLYESLAQWSVIASFAKRRNCLSRITDHDTICDENFV